MASARKAIAVAAVVLMLTTTAVIAAGRPPAHISKPALPGSPGLLQVATSAPPRVVTIGDSVMKGTGLDATEAWPMLLAQQRGWSVTNLGCNAAGFAQVGDPDDCNTNFQGLVDVAAKLHPTVIIISGSSNDLGIRDDLVFTQTLATLKAIRSKLPSVIIFGTNAVWNDNLQIPEQINTIDQQVQQAVEAVGGTYIDIGQPISGRPDLMQGDDVHPTAEGQRELAVAIETGIQNITF